MGMGEKEIGRFFSRFLKKTAGNSFQTGTQSTSWSSDQRREKERRNLEF
jgi:hypothetical protein